MRKVLFICTGNTCRSPMAEYFFNHMAKDEQIDAKALSRGIFANEGEPASAYAVQAAGKYGVDITGHAAYNADGDIVAEADEIFCMTAGHRKMLLSKYPEYGEKISTLLQTDVPDPYGMGIREYEYTAKVIYDAVKNIVESM